jgi:hypothetical protein
MRLLFALSAVMIPLFSLGVWEAFEPAEAKPDPAFQIAQAARPETWRRYTRHAPSTSTPEIVTLRIVGPFDAEAEAKVRLAIEEWNYVLNGFVRFDIAAPGAWHAGAWDIRAEKGGSPQSPDPAGQPLSFTQAGLASIGGRLVIFVDRVGTRDLRGIVLHELGHVLGLGHDTGGNLMSARYSLTAEQCVDKPSVEAIAARRKLPADRLNWCDTDPSGGR